MQGTTVGNAVRSVTEEAEVEITRLIAYMNDKVVPELRHSSSKGLRLAAAQLSRMAEQLERVSPSVRAQHSAPASGNANR